MLIRLIALCLFIFAGDTLAALELDRIIAVVDDDVVMRSELDQQLTRVRRELRQQGNEMPPTGVLERQVMERLILQKIQLQLADRVGVVVTDENLERAINDIAEKNKLTIPQFKEILRSEGYDFDKFREDIREEIILSKLRREEVDKRIQVNESEIDNYLVNETHQGESGEEVKIAHILISVPSGTSDSAREAARAKAESALERLQAGEDFGALAIAMSDSQDALDRGDLGWRKVEQVPSLFADVVANLQVDEFSDIVTSPSGFHLVKITGRRSGEKVMVEQTHVRHILISPNELVTEKDAIERLRQLRLRLESGDDFATLARTHSDDRGSALQGGDLGWVGRGQMVPEFEEVMVNSDPGKVSAPFRSEFGWHILEVLDRRTYDGTDEVKRARARDAILHRKREEAYQEWLRRLRDEAYVEMRAE